MAFYLSVYPYFQSYLLVVHDQSVASAGRIVQTFTFTSTITSIIVSFAIKYTKHYKYFVVVGSLVYALGLALMLRYRTEGASIVSIIGSQILLGMGGSMIHVPAQLGVQASASHQEVASATAVFLTVLEIGGAVGNAISGAIWTNNVPAKLARYLPPETQDQAAAIFANVSLAATGWPIGSPTRIAINRAYQEAMSKILSVAVCIAVPCILLSFLMKNYKLDELDQQVKGIVVGGTQDVPDQRDSENVPSLSRRSSATSEDSDRSSDVRQEERRSLIAKARRKSS